MVVVVSVVAQVVVELGGSVGCVELMQDVGDRLLRLEKLAQEESLSSWLRVLEDRSTFWKGKTLQTPTGQLGRPG